MVEILTVTTLRHKSDEIRRAIIGYEEKLDQLKADLVHVSAAIAICDGGTECSSPQPIEKDRLFARVEPITLAKQVVLHNGPMSSRELAQHIMAVKVQRGGNAPHDEGARLRGGAYRKTLA